jgi:hypothetical protein
MVHSFDPYEAQDLEADIARLIAIRRARREARP